MSKSMYEIVLSNPHFSLVNDVTRKIAEALDLPEKYEVITLHNEPMITYVKDGETISASVSRLPERAVMINKTSIVYPTLAECLLRLVIEQNVDIDNINDSFIKKLVTTIDQLRLLLSAAGIGSGELNVSFCGASCTINLIAGLTRLEMGKSAAYIVSYNNSIMPIISSGTDIEKANSCFAGLDNYVSTIDLVTTMLLNKQSEDGYLFPPDKVLEDGASWANHVSMYPQYVAQKLLNDEALVKAVARREFVAVMKAVHAGYKDLNLELHAKVMNIFSKRI